MYYIVIRSAESICGNVYVRSVVVMDLFLLKKACSRGIFPL